MFRVPIEWILDFKFRYSKIEKESETFMKKFKKEVV